MAAIQHQQQMLMIVQLHLQQPESKTFVFIHLEQETTEGLVLTLRVAQPNTLPHQSLAQFRL